MTLGYLRSVCAVAALLALALEVSAAVPQALTGVTFKRIVISGNSAVPTAALDSIAADHAGRVQCRR